MQFTKKVLQQKGLVSALLVKVGVCGLQGWACVDYKGGHVWITRVDVCGLQRERAVGSCCDGSSCRLTTSHACSMHTLPRGKA